MNVDKMSYTRRMKKVSHDGVLNVFDLDGDIDEMSLAVDGDEKDKDVVNKKTKHQTNGGGYIDPLSKKKYVDPLSNRSWKNTVSQNEKSLETPKKSETNEKDIKEAKGNYISNCMSTKSTLNERQTTQRVPPNTQPNQRNPTFASNNANRNRVTPRMNKPQKGFGHEEHDIVLDDMEDL